MKNYKLIVTVTAFCILITALADAQQGPGRGFGPGMGRGMRGGHAAGASQREGMQHARHEDDDRHDADHEVFQFLLQNHDKINRRVVHLINGVETLTESDSPEVAAKIKEHVEWMEHRITEANPIRMRDPLFAEIFKHTSKIKLVRTDTENGVSVIETSEDPYVATLIQAHAKVVSGFVDRGFTEAMKNHSIPGEKPIAAPQPVYPVIANHGAVVKLANATQQPRTGTKLLVDLTRGGDAGKLNAAIEKLAKYVNIYASGGNEPAEVQIAVVFHGEATLTVLNSDAYSAKFKTDGNPNLQLLHELHEAGVSICVCGQSLHSKGAEADEVATFVDVAVSALTAVVNFQEDGFAYFPLAN